MKLIKGERPERGAGWVRPFLNGGMVQKSYGQKVGHVMARSQPPASVQFVALFDGRHIGTYDSEEKAKDAVDAIGNEWLR